MKFKLNVGSGMDNYLSTLSDLSYQSSDMIGKAIYEGASIVADAIKQNIETIPVDERSSGQLNGLKSIQIAGLKHGFGISRKRDDNGYINVKAGFDGYNNLKTKKYPGGQPNAMIARTIESGNSFTQKHPFVAPAVRSSKDRAEARMAEVIDQEISRVVN